MALTSEDCKQEGWESFDDKGPNKNKFIKSPFIMAINIEGNGCVITELVPKSVNSVLVRFSGRLDNKEDLEFIMSKIK